MLFEHIHRYPLLFKLALEHVDITREEKALMTAESEIVFQCNRKRQIAIVGGGLASLTLVCLGIYSLLFMHPGPHSNPVGGAIFAFVSSVPLLVLAVRGFAIGRLKVWPDYLVYVGLPGQKRFNRSDIERIEVITGQIPPSVRNWQMVQITEKGGTQTTLGSFTVPKAKENATSGEGFEQIVMVLKLNDWLVDGQIR